VTEGRSNKVIARAVEIADATVKARVKAIIRKIGVTNRTQAAMWAMRNPPPERGIDNGSTDPAVAAVQPTPPLDAGCIEGDSDLQLPPVEWPAAGHAVAKATASSLKVHKVGTPSNAFFQRHTPLDGRRAAEEEERLANLATKTNHLRELRRLRETAEREALENNSASLTKEEAKGLDLGRTFDGQQ
jgi:hypothetical protein